MVGLFFLCGTTHPRWAWRRITFAFTIALIGFVGGLLTGVSPCIMPVLPVVFFAGAQTAGNDIAAQPVSGAGLDAAVQPKPTSRSTVRPYLVIGGLVLSFSVVTLTGSALLSLLHLPQDAIRWIALVVLVAIGLGLIFPRVQHLLERPFARIPQEDLGVVDLRAGGSPGGPPGGSVSTQAAVSRRGS